MTPKTLQRFLPPGSRDPKSLLPDLCKEEVAIYPIDLTPAADLPVRIRMRVFTNPRYQTDLS